MKHLRSETQELLNDRSLYDDAAKKISEYIKPGRCINYVYSKPSKRKLYSAKIINGEASDASLLLSAALLSGLTSPTRPWMSLRWIDERLKRLPYLKQIQYAIERTVYDYLTTSNFYGSIHSTYDELINYGTCPLWITETDSEAQPFQLDPLSWGEYVIDSSYNGVIDTIFQFGWYSAKQLIEEYGERTPPSISRLYKQNGITTDTFCVVKAVKPEKYQDKAFKGTHFLYSWATQSAHEDFEEPLRVEGYYEFPAPTFRWDLDGQDKYGRGVGHRVIQDVMRLQQMERTFLMGAHKDADPPLNIPAQMRGMTDLLPGGQNFFSNPQAVISPVFQGRYNFQGVSIGIDRVIQRVKTAYFNDLFLTGTRDPNASPYKAAEVQARENERMLRLGPMIGRIGFDGLQPAIVRIINILARKRLLPEIPSDVQGQLYAIDLIGPLAQAQKALAAAPMLEFFQIVGMFGQANPTALDKVNIDRAIDEIADVKGVPTPILNTVEEVAQIREARAAQQQKMQQQQEAMIAAKMQSELSKTNSETSLNNAEAAETTMSLLPGL